MKIVNRSMISILTLSFIVSACGHNRCFRRHIQSFDIGENQTGTEMTLRLCKGGVEPSVQAAVISNQKSVRIYEATTYDRASRYDGSCSDDYTKRDVYTKVPVALTSSSFSVTKLCYATPDKTRVSFVPPGQPCPSGTQEQEAPVDDCVKLND